MTSEKPPAAHYLREMARFARLVHGEKIDHKDWAAKKKYVRINGGGLRVVSLCSDSPCGAIDGHPTRRTPYRLHDALAGRIPDEGRKRPKPEHRLQATLIEHAIRWPESLPELLHLSRQCSQMRLVTDELAVGDIRADVVFAAEKDGVWFPVFVELKNSRSKDTLIRQLKNIANAITGNQEAASAFEEFMRAAAKIEGPVDLSRHLKLLIWPKNPGAPQFHAFEGGIQAVEFDPKAALPDRYDAPVLALQRAPIG